MESVLGGLCGGVLLSIFYSSLRHRWPEDYASLHDTLDSYLSRHFLRYSAFRIVPVYLTGVFVGVTTERINGVPELALVIVILAHLATSNGRALALLLRGSGGARRGNLLFYHGLICTVLIAVTWAAAITYPSWARPIPEPSDVVVAFWTGLFAAILAVLIQRSASFHESHESLVERGKRGIGPNLWAYAADAAARAGCDADVVRAIMVAEVLQRPRWVRRLETSRARSSSLVATVLLRYGRSGRSQTGSRLIYWSRDSPGTIRSGTRDMAMSDVLGWRQDSKSTTSTRDLSRSSCMLMNSCSPTRDGTPRSEPSMADH